MKIIASLAVLVALAAIAAPSDAVAGGHRRGHSVIVVQGRSAFVAHPFFVQRPFLVHRPLANRSIIIVRRPFVRHVFVPAQPVIVQRTIILPGGTPFSFTSPTGFLVIP